MASGLHIFFLCAFRRSRVKTESGSDAESDDPETKRLKVKVPFKKKKIVKIESGSDESEPEKKVKPVKSKKVASKPATIAKAASVSDAESEKKKKVATDEARTQCHNVEISFWERAYYALLGKAMLYVFDDDPTCETFRFEHLYKRRQDDLSESHQSKLRGIFKNVCDFRSEMESELSKEFDEYMTELCNNGASTVTGHPQYWDSASRGLENRRRAEEKEAATEKWEDLDEESRKFATFSDTVIGMLPQDVADRAREVRRMHDAFKKRRSVPLFKRRLQAGSKVGAGDAEAKRAKSAGGGEVQQAGSKVGGDGDSGAIGDMKGGESKISGDSGTGAGVGGKQSTGDSGTGAGVGGKAGQSSAGQISGDSAGVGGKAGQSTGAGVGGKAGQSTGAGVGGKAGQSKFGASGDSDDGDTRSITSICSLTDLQKSIHDLKREQDQHAEDVQTQMTRRIQEQLAVQMDGFMLQLAAMLPQRVPGITPTLTPKKEFPELTPKKEFPDDEVVVIESGDSEDAGGKTIEDEKDDAGQSGDADESAGGGAQPPKQAGAEPLQTMAVVHPENEPPKQAVADVKNEPPKQAVADVKNDPPKQAVAKDEPKQADADVKVQPQAVADTPKKQETVIKQQGVAESGGQLAGKGKKCQSEDAEAGPSKSPAGRFSDPGKSVTSADSKVKSTRRSSRTSKSPSAKSDEGKQVGSPSNCRRNIICAFDNMSPPNGPPSEVEDNSLRVSNWVATQVPEKVAYDGCRENVESDMPEKVVYDGYRENTLCNLNVQSDILVHDG